MYSYAKKYTGNHALANKNVSLLLWLAQQNKGKCNTEWTCRDPSVAGS